jgi:histidyl-tRNA synthetase
MKGADKVNAHYVVLIGEDELANGTVWVKDLESKEEQTINLEAF